MDNNNLKKSPKELFINRLEKIISDEAYEANPSLTKSAYIEVVYTEIMALGYNFGNIQKAVDDIYEVKSILQGESKKLRVEILKGIIETSKIYANEVNIFSQFHRSYQQGTDYNVLVEELNKKLT